MLFSSSSSSSLSINITTLFAFFYCLSSFVLHIRFSFFPLLHSRAQRIEQYLHFLSFCFCSFCIWLWRFFLRRIISYQSNRNVIWLDDLAFDSFFFSTWRLVFERMSQLSKKVYERDGEREKLPYERRSKFDVAAYLMRNPCRSMLRDERDSLSLYCLFHGSLKCSNERLDDLKLIETDITPSLNKENRSILIIYFIDIFYWPET